MAGLATIVALVAVAIWDGGDAPTFTGSPGIESPTGVLPGGSTGGSSTEAEAGGGDSSAAPSGGSPTDAPVPAFDPLALAPAGGRQVPPGLVGVNVEWQVDGSTWQAVLAPYQQAFPVAGWELGRLSTNWGGPGGKGGEGYEIVPTDGGPNATPIGSLDVHQAGDDAGGILVSYTAR